MAVLARRAAFCLGGLALAYATSLWLLAIWWGRGPDGDTAGERALEIVMALFGPAAAALAWRLHKRWSWWIASGLAAACIVSYGVGLALFAVQMSSFD
jgi:hypothetical protein